MSVPNASSSMKDKVAWLLRLFQGLIVAVSALALIATLYLVLAETFFWKPAPKNYGPHDAFFKGSIGTEFAPLAVFKILPALFPEHFQPAGPEAGSWVEQYGFIPGDDATGLPLGFFVSHYRPRSAYPTPTAFVGVGCGACHSAVVRRADGEEGSVVRGAGNPSVDVSAFFEAFRAAVLAEENPSGPRDKNDDAADIEYKLNMDSIQTKLEELGEPELGLLDRLMVSIWLGAVRDAFIGGQVINDEPTQGADLRDADFQMTGPNRTRPFNTLTRVILGRLAKNHTSDNFNQAFTKIPAIFRQDDREWAQFDGGMRNLYARSALAAMTVGATPASMAHPEIYHNLFQASEYTRTLEGTPYRDMFPDKPIDEEMATRGATVYRQHCAYCHGDKTAGGQWAADPAWAPRFKEVVPVEELGTDPERADIRHMETLADLLHARFPPDHPLAFDRADVRPGPAGKTRGYFNGPIDSAYLRAPFLHNASVPTLAELINLVPRRDRFYRGANLYDPDQVGLLVSQTRDVQRYWLFDAGVRGNSNAGHDYPWAIDDPERDEAALRDLLEYLKTL